jgi:hypothetical protein
VTPTVDDTVRACRSGASNAWRELASSVGVTGVTGVVIAVVEDAARPVARRAHGDVASDRCVVVIDIVASASGASACASPAATMRQLLKQCTTGPVVPCREAHQMQRWKHAGRGPKCTLIVGILLGVASLVLYNAAYAAAEPPYPGSPALPGIPNGPKIGCLPTGSSKETWVCNFNVRSHTTFTVNGRAAGGYQADTNGCVLITLSFSGGTVSVNGNAPVPIREGTNYLIIKGHKTTTTGTYVIGLRMAFTIPHGNAKTCVISPPTTSTTSVSSTTSTARPRFPRFTTSTRFQPTTLAKVLETPLEISPNKVILESSLMAAVLAAMLSAGALGSIWNAEGSAATSAAMVGAAGAASSTGEGSGPPGPDDGGGPPAPDGGGGPPAPDDGGGPPAPQGGEGATGGGPDGPPEPSAPPPTTDPPRVMGGEAPPVANAFTRTNLRRPSPGGGGS